MQLFSGQQIGPSANLHFRVEKEFPAELHCREKITSKRNFSPTTVSGEQLIGKMQKKEKLERLSHLENTAL